MRFMTNASVKRFVAAVCDFVPIKCTVVDSFNVENTFYTEQEMAALGSPKDKIPLFAIDLTVGADGRP